MQSSSSIVKFCFARTVTMILYASPTTLDSHAMSIIGDGSSQSPCFTVKGVISGGSPATASSLNVSKCRTYKLSPLQKSVGQEFASPDGARLGFRHFETPSITPKPLIPRLCLPQNPGRPQHLTERTGSTKTCSKSPQKYLGPWSTKGCRDCTCENQNIAIVRGDLGNSSIGQTQGSLIGCLAKLRKA